MYEEYFKKVTKEANEKIGYIAVCDKCGTKREVIKGKTTEFDNDIKDFSVSFGYESRFDGERWSFDLCENCLLDVIKTFKYVPSGFRQDSYSDASQEEHQSIFEHWKETGEWEEFKFKTYEELAMLDGLYDTEYVNQLIKTYHPDKPLLEVIK